MHPHSYIKTVYGELETTREEEEEWSFYWSYYSVSIQFSVEIF